MSDAQQPQGAPPEAPWNQAPPPPVSPTAPTVLPQPGETVTDGGVVLPGQQPSPLPSQQQAPPQGTQPGEQPPLKEVEQGPWNDIACHRSWLMGGQPMPVNVEKPAKIDARTQQIVDPGGVVREIHVVPMIPSPYQCIGPKCNLYDVGREGCVERLLFGAQLELAERQLEPMTYKVKPTSANVALETEAESDPDAGTEE